MALGYSTQNFLGMGETFTLNLQQRHHAKNYQFAFTEPYLFNCRPISASISPKPTTLILIFIPARVRASTFPRRPVSGNIGGHRWYTAGKISPSATSTKLIILRIPIIPIIYTEGKRSISALSPTIYYSTVDSPIFPRLRAANSWPVTVIPAVFSVVTLYSHKFKLELIRFQPMWQNHVLGMHAVYEGIEPFGGKGIPLYEKFFLGGERSIRGFDSLHTSGPGIRTAMILGGNKSICFQLRIRHPADPAVLLCLFL